MTFPEFWALLRVYRRINRPQVANPMAMQREQYEVLADRLEAKGLIEPRRKPKE